MTPDENENQQSRERVGQFKKIRAVICKYCPACLAARKSPHSVVGRLLHHPLHADNCPMWTAYQQVYGEQEKTGLQGHAEPPETPPMK